MMIISGLLAVGHLMQPNVGMMMISGSAVVAHVMQSNDRSFVLRSP